LSGGAVGHPAYVHRKHLAARRFDARHEFVLHPQAAYQAVEVGGDDHVSVATLDGFDGVTQPRPLMQRRAAAHIELGQRFDQEQVVPLTGRFDSPALLLR
jgi:hypothetical protein